MEKRIAESVEGLKEAILASDEYNEYDTQRKLVNQNPKLKAEIDAYRTANFEMQTRQDYALDKIDAFEKKYAEFRRNPLVNDFLAAELGFCRLMQEINLCLTEAVAFE